VQNPQLQRNVPITEKRVELKTVKMSQLEFGTGGWPPISTWIMEAANSYQHYLQAKEALHQGNFQYKFKDYELNEDGPLMHGGKVYVPKS
jgi:hypothetical protein